MSNRATRAGAMGSACQIAVAAAGVPMAAGTRSDMTLTRGLTATEIDSLHRAHLTSVKVRPRGR